MKPSNCIRVLLSCLVIDIMLLSFCAARSGRRDHPLRLFRAGFFITLGLIFVLIFFLKRAYRLKAKEDVQRPEDAAQMDMEVDAEFLKALTGLPTRFSFLELQSATNNFSKKLGKGGFGSVYQGTLSEGSTVAVKRLEKEGHGQKEFCAEVATISRVRHANLVCLKGFCAEGGERLLVYEFMPRGSLDRWIFRNRDERVLFSTSYTSLSSDAFVVLNMETRCRIALETARGLAYLHEECEKTILHLDVKPQNILLDEQFRVKVSDFGLSRCMDRAQSRLVTTIRGTPGYLAPEWFLEAGIDSKTDVYSFGMVVLELVSGRRTVDQSEENPEHWFLPAMAFKKLREDLAMDMIDPLLQGMVDENSCKQALAMIKVACWCIQEEAAMRPKMSSVVQMLEGRMEVMPSPLSRNFLSTRRAEKTLILHVNDVIDTENITLPR